MRAPAALIVSLLAALALIGCGGGDDRRVLTATDAAFVPVLETTDLIVGDTRIVLTLLDRSEEPRFAANTSFSARFFEPTEGGIRFRAEAELERIEVGGFGYYIARDVPLDHPGDWAVAVTASRGDGTSESSPRVGFPVGAAAHRPLPGSAAPLARSLSTEDAPPADVTGDPSPHPGLYERSTSELLEAGEPFLLVIGSSERCAGRATCRRALEQAKTLADQGRVAVVHVEPFGRPREPRLQVVIDAFNEAWGVRAEPGFWFVGEEGEVAAYLAIVATDDELAGAISRIAR